METVDLIIVLFATFAISMITLMSGFGIGTVLTPTFALFFDVKTAVFLVALVHIFNNFLKFSLFARHVNQSIFLRFGLLSLMGAIAGSLLQGKVDPSLLKVFLGLFLVTIGILEFTPQRTWKFPQQFDVVGGFLSGLMGGLIGNQGAIRSAYLLNYDLSKEAFIATATAISIVIDLSRIPIYVIQQSAMLEGATLELPLVIGVAFAGTLVGKQVLKKVSLERFRLMIAIMLIIVGIGFLFPI